VTAVVAIAGAIASGKSTLARGLADRWSCPRAAFGRLVAHEAAARRSSTERDGLQALGSNLIEELGWREFCRRTLELAGADWSTAPLVIDGLRHRAALDTLRAHVAVAPVSLVLVTCERSTRSHRQLARGATREDIRRWEQDPTERELGELAELADAVVSGEAPVSVAIEQVERALRGPA